MTDIQLNDEELKNIFIQMSESDFDRFCKENSQSKFCKRPLLENIYEQKTRNEFSQALIDFKPRDLIWGDFYKRLDKLFNLLAIDDIENIVIYYIEKHSLLELKILSELRGDDIFTIDDANLATERGFDDILRLLLSKNIYPESMSVDTAIENGCLNIILLLKFYRYNFTNEDLNLAYAYGQLELVKIFEEMGLQTDQRAYSLSAHNNRIDILEHLKRKNIPFSDDIANIALINNRLPLLQWALNNGIQPDQVYVNNSAYNGRLEIVKLLAQHGFLPNRRAATNAALNGHLEILQFLEQFDILPYRLGIESSSPEVRFWLANRI
ncbi:MAG: hypothetical protein Solivirus2_26 [Solivirus sp.]|uniref:Ankyrin repeat protein n=1 Tax=Solivirus sp. TaxID=2487772 RepID=A0A3G5AFF7_9VIRU|nr:MAG: hypothetical protein Solivirus2_26 [Solivirus sp.]